MSLQLAAASYIYIHCTLKKKSGGGGKGNSTQAGKCTAVQVCWADLNFKSVSGLYKNFTRMSPSEFECLIHFIGEKISKKDTALRKATSVQESFGTDATFLGKW
jgi:hypothetical protein